MARSRRLFKTTSNMHVETVADTDWSSFAVLEKQQDSFRSAWIEKVRITYCLAEEDSAPGWPGFLFIASLDQDLDSTTPANNDGQVLASGTGRGGAATVTLNIQRSVKFNRSDNSSSIIPDMLEKMAGAPIFLHIHSSKIGEQTQALLCVEVFGRWHKCTSL